MKIYQVNLGIILQKKVLRVLGVLRVFGLLATFLQKESWDVSASRAGTQNLLAVNYLKLTGYKKWESQSPGT